MVERPAVVPQKEAILDKTELEGQHPLEAVSLPHTQSLFERVRVGVDYLLHLPFTARTDPKVSHQLKKMAEDL